MQNLEIIVIETGLEEWQEPLVVDAFYTFTHLKDDINQSHQSLQQLKLGK